MQYITIATALLSSAILTNAAPTTSSTLERRACQVAYPRAIGFPINYDIHQDANRANERVNNLSFNNVPAGSYGCQLEVNFPAGYPITSSGASAINIFALDNDKSTLFGTVTLQSSPVAPTKFVINSAECKPLMSYKIQIASDTQAGQVAFADTQDAGFTMTYNC
jgi:hypothetical protein